MLHLLVIAFTSLLVILLISKWNARLSYWKERGVPVCKVPGFIKGFLTGNVYFDSKVYEDLKGHPYGGYMELWWNPVFYVMDLDLIKQICIKDFEFFVDRRGFDIGKQDPHLYHTLLNQRGEAWKQLRAFMSPSFTTRKMKRMFGIFSESATKLCTAIKKECNEGSSSVELSEFYQKVTMDTIASATLGLQTDVFDKTDSVYLRVHHLISQQFSGPGILKLLLSSVLPRLCTVLKLRVTNPEADRFLTSIIKEAIRRRESTGEKREDFLQLMLEARAAMENSTEGSKLDISDDVIIAQAIVFVLAGSDTIEGFFNMATYLLATNPEVQCKLHLEVKDAYEKNDSSFTYDAVHAIDYLERFVQETLRMYTPAVRTERICTKDYTVPGTDLVLPKGSVVAIPVLPVQRDPEYWEDPMKCDPDRFLPERSRDRHPCAYMPFGLGPRFCIGNRFALEEAKVILAHLVLNFEFDVCEKTPNPVLFTTSGSMKPEGEMWFQVTVRQ